MVEIQSKLTGDIESGLDKFQAKVAGRVLFVGVAATALPIYTELKINTMPPRLGRVTGNLHDAVYRAYSPERSKDGLQIYHVSVNKKKAPHWHLIEYGTSRSPAKPYIRPAFDRMPEAIERGKSRMTQLMASGEMVSE